MAGNDNSILTDVKKMCGLPEGDASYDLDIMIHTNTAFSTLNDLGVGPPSGFMIEDATPTWTDFLAIDSPRFIEIKSYIYLKVRLLFDPPGTSFLLSAHEKMVAEFEWRLNARRELTDWEDPMPEEILEDDLII